MKRSGTEEIIKKRKRHLLPVKKDLEAQYLEAFQWEPGDFVFNLRSDALCDLRQRIRLHIFLLKTGVDIFSNFQKDIKDSSNTIVNKYFSFGAGHYQLLCVQNIGFKYL